MSAIPFVSPSARRVAPGERPNRTRRPRPGRAARRACFLAATCALMVGLFLRGSPARAQYGGLNLIGVVVLVAGTGLATGSTITDIGIGHHLATTDSVPGKWSKTGLVLSSIQSTLGGSLLALTLDNWGSTGFDAPKFAAISSAYLVHGLGSMALSIYGMTRRPPEPARRPDGWPRAASPTPSLAGMSPVVLSRDGGAAPGLAMSFRW